MERNNQNYDLKEKLINKMNENAERNGLEDRGKYISSKDLGELFNDENLRAHVSQVFGYWPWRWLPNPERDSLVSKIQYCGQKLYAILVMLDEPGIIRELLYGKPEVDDRMLFGKNESGYHKLCSEATLRRIPHLKGIAKEFYRVQSHFPPKLYLEKTVQEFDPLYCVMPFVQKGHAIGHGSFGIVFETEIEEEFLKPCKYAKVYARALGLFRTVKLTQLGFESRVQTSHPRTYQQRKKTTNIQRGQGSPSSRS